MQIALYLSQRDIHTVAASSAPGDLSSKSHPKDLSTEIDNNILIWSPIQVQTEANVA